jgi:putative acetyltransferase
MLKRVWRLLGRSKPTTTKHTALCDEHTPTPPPAPLSTQADDDFAMPFDIRPMTAEDGDALRQVFRHSITSLASADYNADMMRAWADTANQPEFVAHLERGITLVAVLHGERVGFAQLYPASHIEMLYLSPPGNGLGIAALLYQYLEDEARIAGSKTLTTASSLTARRFFEGMGFRLVNEETVSRNGVDIPRLQMEKRLING